MDVEGRTRRSLISASLGVGALALFPAAPVLLAADAATATVPAGVLAKPLSAGTEPVPVVGVGTARRYDVEPGSDACQRLAQALVAFAGMGGRLVDTSPSYGRAEAVLGRILREHDLRDRLLLATKVGAGGEGEDAGRAQIEASFRRLGVERIELLQIHNLAGIGTMLPVLRALKADGRIGLVGATTAFKDQYPALEAAMLQGGLDVVQVDYAIDNREAAERILPLAADLGIGVLANLPFGRGRVFQALGGRRLPDWAQALGISSWAQFALKYVVSHPAVSCAIPGTATRAYAEDNFGAALGALPDSDTRRRMVDLLEAG
ncbi:MAG: aldo/keto reductase [Lysobacteraceae bacterium]